MIAQNRFNFVFNVRLKFNFRFGWFQYIFRIWIKVVFCFSVEEQYFVFDLNLYEEYIMKINEQYKYYNSVFVVFVVEKYLQVLRNDVQRFCDYDFGLFIFKILKFEGRVRFFLKEESEGLIVDVCNVVQWILLLIEVLFFKCIFFN